MMSSILYWPLDTQCRITAKRWNTATFVSLATAAMESTTVQVHAPREHAWRELRIHQYDVRRLPP